MKLIPFLLYGKYDRCFGKYKNTVYYSGLKSWMGSSVHVVVNVSASCLMARRRGGFMVCNRLNRCINCHECTLVITRNGTYLHYKKQCIQDQEIVILFITNSAKT